MIQVSISRRSQLQSSETDVIESFIVNAEGLIRIFHQLVDRQSGIVGLHNCIRYFR